MNSKPFCKKVTFWGALILFVLSAGICIYAKSNYDPYLFAHPASYLWYRYFFQYTVWLSLGYLIAHLFFESKCTPFFRRLTLGIGIVLGLLTIVFFIGVGAMVQLPPVLGGLSKLTNISAWLWAAQNPSVFFIPGLMLGGAWNTNSKKEDLPQET